MLLNASNTLKEKLISVVIPVYNSEKYLPGCIDGLLLQSHKKIEIVIVDDASPGNVKEIAQDYVGRGYNIRLISHERNRGSYQARATGAKHSQGDYVIFVDSDDSLGVDYLRVLAQEAENTGADIVISKCFYSYDNGYYWVTPVNEPLRNHTLSEEEIKKAYFEQQGRKPYMHTTWGRLYNKSLIEKCLPDLAAQEDHLILIDDFVFSSIAHFHASKYATVDYYGYNYLLREGSVTTEPKTYNKLLKDISDVSLAFNYVGKFLKKYNTVNYDDYLQSWKALIFRTCNDFIAASRLTPKKTADLQGLLCDKMKIDKSAHSRREDSFFSELSAEWDSRYENLAKMVASADYDCIAFGFFDIMVTTPFCGHEDFSSLLYPYKEKENHNSPKYNEKFFRPRRSIKQLYDIARAVNKRILLIANDDGSLYDIKAVLSFCGYEMVDNIIDIQLFDCAKREAFDKLIEDAANIKIQRALYIDNEKSINFVNSVCTLNDSFIFPAPDECFSEALEACSSTYNEHLGTRIMRAQIANMYFDNPFRPIHKNTKFNADPYFIGYYAIGTYMLSLIRRIVEDSASRKYKTVYFAGENTKFLKSLYDIISAVYVGSAKSSMLDIPLDIYSGIPSMTKPQRTQDAFENLSFEAEDVIFDTKFNGELQVFLALHYNIKVDGYCIYSPAEATEVFCKTNGIRIYPFFDSHFCTNKALMDFLLADFTKDSIDTIDASPEESKCWRNLITKGIQKGAFDFVKEFSDLLGSHIFALPYSRETVTEPLESLLSSLHGMDRKLLDLCGLDIVPHEKQDISSVEAARFAPSDSVLVGQKGYKKAIYYFLFDRSVFKVKFNNRLRKRPVILRMLKMTYRFVRKIKGLIGK